jgi:hypothetical protein
MQRDVEAALLRACAILVEYVLRGGAAIALCGVAWFVLATEAADKNRFDPRAALAWTPNNSTALLSLAKESFIRATFGASEPDRESVVFRETWNRGLVLRSDAADLPPVRSQETLLSRVGRPHVGHIDSIARWLDVAFTRNFYASAVVNSRSFQSEIADAFSLPPAEASTSVLAGYDFARRSASRLSSHMNLAVAKALARKSMVADPLNEQALVLLSDISAREGDRRRSEALLLSAAERTLRNPIAQARSIGLLTYRGDYRGAIAKADVLMRGFDGYVQRLAADFLANVALDARSASALSDYVVADPPWRTSLFETIARYNDADSGLRLLFDISSKRATLRSSDMAPTLRLLMKQNRTVEAYLAWVNFLSEEKRSKAGLLFDGNFTEEPSGIPFEWSVAQSPKGSVGFLKDRGMLRVEFVGARIPKIAVHQTLSLSPGRYRLKLEATSHELRAARGVSWRIVCRTDNERILGETEPLRGTKQWQEVSTDFETPQEGCDFPLLRLVLKAKTPLDLIANGVVSFRRMRMLRIAEH